MTMNAEEILGAADTAPERSCQTKLTKEKTINSVEKHFPLSV